MRRVNLGTVQPPNMPPKRPATPKSQTPTRAKRLRSETATPAKTVPAPGAGRTRRTPGASCDDASQVAEPPREVQISADAFPHIIDAIFHYSQRHALLVFRGACKEFRDRADNALATHLIVSDKYPGGVTTPSGRLPVLFSKPAQIKRVASLKSATTVDYVEGMNASQWEKVAAATSISTLRVFEGGKRHVNPLFYPCEQCIVFTLASATCWKPTILPACKRVVFNIEGSADWSKWTEKYLKYELDETTSEVVVVFNMQRSATKGIGMDNRTKPVNALGGVLGPLFYVIAQHIQSHGPALKLTFVGFPDIPPLYLGFEVEKAFSLPKRQKRLLSSLEDLYSRVGVPPHIPPKVRYWVDNAEFITYKEYASRVGHEYPLHTQNAVDITPSEPIWNGRVTCRIGEDPFEIARKAGLIDEYGQRIRQK